MKNVGGVILVPCS